VVTLAITNCGRRIGIWEPLVKASIAPDTVINDQLPTAAIPRRGLKIVQEFLDRMKESNTAGKVRADLKKSLWLGMSEP
jgi:hypothetical protein